MSEFRFKDNRDVYREECKKQKIVWVLFSEEDSEGGLILGIYGNYASGRKELKRLAKKVTITSLMAYPVIYEKKQR